MTLLNKTMELKEKGGSEAAFLKHNGRQPYHTGNGTV